MPTNSRPRAAGFCSWRGPSRAAASPSRSLTRTGEQIETALKPFAQLQSHFNRTQEGTGLGLSLANGLAKLHGGSLSFDSQPGVGTTVILRLPPVAETPKGGA